MIRTKDLAKRAKELGMPAVAMTDHGNLYGAIKFYQDCHKAGVTPRKASVRISSSSKPWVRPSRFILHIVVMAGLLATA